jgi:phenylalanyl-tRNA synthetase beta chain
LRRTRHEHLALAVEIWLNNQIVGIGGQLSAALAAKFDAPGAVLVAELSADVALGTGGASKRYEEFGRFPAVTRDIAMIVPKTVTHEDVYAEILRVPEPLLERVQLFDVFIGKDAEQIGTERKSLAYTLTYRDKSRTLTSDEVTAAHSRIRQRLQSELGAELRE